MANEARVVMRRQRRRPNGGGRCRYSHVGGRFAGALSCRFRVRRAVLFLCGLVRTRVCSSFFCPMCAKKRQSLILYVSLTSILPPTVPLLQVFFYMRTRFGGCVCWATLQELFDGLCDLLAEFFMDVIVEHVLVQGFASRRAIVDVLIPQTVKTNVKIFEKVLGVIF